ncbi:YlbL family protein [Actinomyces howellii]|uniref:endopeptidase La n=1 Tax=Actinomyces howellii TaxID=52771 RepID=A0A3S4R2P3_9ACTO|nr:S16 family serine protease [Actinomyces howellii]VEG30080.1 ATP-dependent protease Lon [Actinomyces howellii]
MTEHGISPDHLSGGSSGGRRPRPRALILAVVGAIAAVGLVVAGATVPINKVIEAPGPTWNVLSQTPEGQEVLTVSGAESYPAGGALRMTTVSVSGCPGHPVTFFMLVDAWLDDDKAVLDRDEVCPDSLSQEEVEQEGQAQMTSSQDAAVVAALMESGLATRMVLTVAGVSQEQTSTSLAEGDVLESITPEGGTTTTITTYTELRELLTTIPAGTPVTLGVTRDGHAVDVGLTTLAPQDQDGDGQADSEGSLLGVYLSASADSDIDAEVALSDVGGPSAGMMFALGIIDELTPGDMTGGQDIAGTGSISFDGQVGAIGGIRQKMAGAAEAGSDYFLAPASNCAEVEGHVPEGMTVAAVSTLDEAVTAVEAIASGDTQALTTCESVLAAD